MNRGFLDGLKAQVLEAGGLPWDDETDKQWAATPRRWPLTQSELQAARELIRLGELETAYDQNSNLVLRVVAPKPEANPNDESRPEDRPYEVSPAVLALRERRRILGR